MYKLSAAVLLLSLEKLTLSSSHWPTILVRAYCSNARVAQIAFAAAMVLRRAKMVALGLFGSCATRSPDCRR